MACFGRSRRYRGREPKAVHGVIRIFAAVMFLLLTLLGADVSAQTDCSDTLATGVAEAECQALVDFYNQTNGANWDINTNWNTDQLINTWYGVVVLNGQVEQLDLSRNQLDGSIPASLGDLTNLEILYLWGNELTGSIPDLSHLTSLLQLNLSRNQLYGSIPASLGNLTNLRLLYIWGNEQLTWDNISNELGEKVDRGVLRTLYNLNGGDEWTNNEKWLSDDDPVSSWYGVSTDAMGRVSGLNLRNNRLKGELTGALETLGIGSLKTSIFLTTDS